MNETRETDRRSLIKGIGTAVIGGFGVIGMANAKSPRMDSRGARAETGTRREGCESMSQELATLVEEEDSLVRISEATILVEPHEREEFSDGSTIRIEDIGCMAPSQSNL